MKKFFITLILAVFISISFVPLVSAQGMMDMMGNSVGEQTNDGHTARGETEGKEIWEKLQTQGVNCENLSEDDFHNLGMYFMGLMAGDSHEAMDTMMEQMMGEDSADQMHVAIGKRMSGCEPNAPMPQTINSGMMPMMNTMMGGGGMIGSGNPMMSWSGGFGSLLFTLTWTVWLVVGVLAAIWLWKQIKKK